jgi:hypothetical protein
MMAAAISVNRLSDRRRLRLIGFGALTMVAAVAGGIGARTMSIEGHTFVVIGLGLIFLPLALWTVPEAGVVLLVLGAAVIEQLPIPPPPFGDIGTDEAFYFTSLTDGAGITGILATPLELTMAMILMVWLVRAIATHTLQIRKSQLAAVVGILLCLVVLAAARGLAQGADVRTDLRELRPWVYLGAGYLIGSQLLNGRRAVWAVLWAFVLGVAVKGLQGTVIFLSELNVHPRPDYIISHEEAVFLTLYILLTAGLWIFTNSGALRRVATTLLPVVVLADLANTRRTAWLIFAAGLIALLVIAWIRLPQRRGLITRAVVALLAGSLLYFPLAWSSTAVWAEPARAFRSEIAPDQRDLESNTYRQFENANLMADIKRTTPLGQGFGIPIDYSALPFRNLADAIPALRFVPHNGILYVWMEMGIAGAIAFWWLIGAALVVACRVARAPDPRLALFGAFTICALLAYLIEGYYDFGLWWFRVAVLMGCLLGTLEAAGRETVGDVAGLQQSPDSLGKAAVGGHEEASWPAGLQQPGGAF